MLYFVVQKATKRLRCARRNGTSVLSSVVELSTQNRLVAGSNPALRTTKLNAKTRLATCRKWLKAEVFGQFGGWNGRKLFWPWQYAARLGAPIQSLARLTVSKLLTRRAGRVNRHTHTKKAVMTIYRRAGANRMTVDTWATIAVQATGTPAKGWSPTA